MTSNNILHTQDNNQTRVRPLTPNNKDNNMKKPYDNDLNRCVERARKGGVSPAFWQCVNTTTGQLTYVDMEDLHTFERANNIGLTWLISPIFDRNLCDINGNINKK